MATFAAMGTAEHPPTTSSIIAIVQARMGSSRLPKKVLMPLAGKPMIDHLLEGVATVLPRNAIWVATSEDTNCDPLATYLTEAGWPVFRGDETNVASRFAALARQTQCTHFIRMSGDSPWLDPAVIRLAIAQVGENDVVTTITDTPFPSGSHAELVRATTFLEAYDHFSDPGHFEHVTPYFYSNRDQFAIQNLVCPVANARQYKFAVDTPEDMERMRQLFAQISGPHYQLTLEEKCQLFHQLFITT